MTDTIPTRNVELEGIKLMLRQARRNLTQREWNELVTTWDQRRIARPTYYGPERRRPRRSYGAR